ncbi:DUF397 domain-containing protein [Amycolatopsis sp. Hca4]|nr:DUF397 domain-containing protein [Amycolatopsis sp. Hca4]QKV81053.1 DUF397 domain-containing protein [Amycolatopsis sp. Hca4]
MTPGLRWVKSSASGSGTQGDDCVEVARTSEHVLIRDSKQPDTWLSLPPGSWLAFLRRL